MELEAFDLNQTKHKGVIIIGPRCSGKTHLIYDILRSIMASECYFPSDEEELKEKILMALKDKRAGNTDYRTIVMDNNQLAVSKCQTLSDLARNGVCYNTHYILSVGDIKGVSLFGLLNSDFIFFAGYDKRSITTFTELTGDENTSMYCEKYLTENYRFLVFDARNKKFYIHK